MLKSEKKYTGADRKIISAIIKNGPRTTSELKENTGLNSDTINNRGKVLAQRGLVEKVGGKFGKYHLKIKVYNNPTYRAFLFSNSILPKITQLNITMDKENIMCKMLPPADLSKDDIYKLEYVLNNRISESDIESLELNKNYIFGLKLSRFANRIGAYIIYTILEALSANAWNPKFDDIRLEEILGSGNDKAVEEYVRSCINPIRILYEFLKLDIVEDGLPIWNFVPEENLRPLLGRKLVSGLPPEKQEEAYENNKALYNYYQEYNARNRNKRFNPKNSLWSRYKIDENTRHELVSSFRRVWPDLFEFFEKNGYKK